MPILAAAGIAAGGSILGGLMGSSSAKKAAKTQAAAADRATQAQMDMFKQNQKNIAPWMESGQTANTALMQLMGLPVDSPGGGGSLMEPFTSGMPNSMGETGGLLTHLLNGQMPNRPMAGQGQPNQPTPNMVGANYGMGMKPFTPNDLWMDPSYQWQLNQGLEQIKNASTVGKGGPMAGNTLRAIQDYTQGLASTNYQQAYNNYNSYINNLFSRLSGMSGMGASAASGISNLGANVANQVGGNIIGAGNAQAAGQMGSANALASGIGGVGNAAMMYAMMKGGGGGTPPMGGGGMSYPLAPASFSETYDLGPTSPFLVQ